MNDGNELDPVARLRAADPAADVEPSAGFADEVVAKATAEPAVVSAAVTDLTAKRARRSPRWLPIAAVAASIAIVGGAGYGLGAATGGSTNLADGAAPPISLQTGATQEGAVGTVPGSGPEAAIGLDRKMMPGSGAAGTMMFPYGSGRNRFSSSGLATTESTALAYAFDAHAASNAANVTALASALGIEGTAELKNGGWTVGPQDGTAPSIYVGLDGTLGFYYSNPLINPWQCVEGTDVAKQCEPTGDLPSEDAAIDALRSLIASVGRDPATFEFTSETWEGAVSRMAQAWPVVDGQRLDQAWSLELTDAGVFSASGALADIVALGDYAVVSEEEGFERLSDPRFGAQMTNMPIALREQSAIASEEWAAPTPTEPPATPTEGTSLSWPVNEVEIVSARLGLTSQWQPDGSVLVVPAYEFTDAEGATWSVIAVADSMLDFESD